MTSKTAQCINATYFQPQITVVVHDPLSCEFQDNVTNAGYKNFAQAFTDFANDLSQAVALSFVKLPTTIQDIDQLPESYSRVSRPITHDRLSLAEMGLSGYKSQ